MNRHSAHTALSLLAVLTLAACGNSEFLGGDPAKASAFKTFKVCDGPQGPAGVQTEALKAFFDAHEGDTIEFCAGSFDMTTGLIVAGRRGITIRGAGRDKTILNFKNSDSAEGINVNHVDGITIEGLTVLDTPGNSIRVFKSKYVTIRDVAAGWSDSDPVTPGYQPASSNGAYALYPVECRHVLIEDSYAFGSSDAGVYVGQSSDIVVRHTTAKYNVAGFEFENTYRAVFEDNIATENTAGFLVFDLPNLAQYGEKNVVRNNKTYNNNTENFAPIGNIVGLAPRGTGMLVLATDQLEIYGNEIYDHDTLGLAIVNFGLVDPEYPDLKYDFFPEGMHVHDNLFRNNGGRPQEPNPDRGEGSVLPFLLVAKNGGRSAHIVWDGGVDEPNGCTNYPTDQDGVPLNQPNSRETDRYEARSDERGRPNYDRPDPGPNCGKPGDPARMRKYNAWKFNAASALKTPENWLCIEESNRFENTTPQTALVTPFLNMHFSTPDPTDPRNLQPASNDLTPHRCTLPSRAAELRPLKLPFKPSAASGDARPSASEIKAACEQPLKKDEINRAALARYNCPQLHQYGLFANPSDPRSAPQGGGVPFEINSALFSDYAVKYRVLFLPPGGKARYLDHHEAASATLDFPVGTVIAKTFAFRKDDIGGKTIAENVVETRLLIKRQTGTGVAWVGLPYIWNKDGAGRLTTADLHVEGGRAAVEYDFVDPDPEVKDATGQRKRYTGKVAAYGIPAALNCVTCHGGDDREAGAPPIGPKPRYLNRSNPALGGMNQLQYLDQHGLLVGLPHDPAAIEKHPRWNVPGDSGQTPDSDADIHQRVRAYLEVNCMHCHNSNGAASNSGLFLDAYRTVDNHYGICKKPVAAGRGSGGRKYDIVPGAAPSNPAAHIGSDASILYYRLASAEAGVRMPPIARTVVHGEAANLIAQWIDQVLPTEDTENEETCTGLTAGP